MKDKNEDRKKITRIHELEESILSMLPKVTYGFSVVPLKYQRKSMESPLDKNYFVVLSVTYSHRTLKYIPQNQAP